LIEKQAKDVSYGMNTVADITHTLAHSMFVGLTRLALIGDRFTVHEKLVNFMPPVEKELPTYVDELFANLFAN
jgi:hypothetical protein